MVDEDLTIRARLKLKTAEEGGRHSPIKTGHRPNHVFEYDKKDKPAMMYVGPIEFDNE